MILVANGSQHSQLRMICKWQATHSGACEIACAFCIIIIPKIMQFEFDPAKSATNKLKHGIDFDDAKLLWGDPMLLEAPTRTTDEPRFIAVGMIG